MESNKVASKILMALIVLLAGVGCNPFQVGAENDFYDYSKVNYIMRLPLINPYEIRSADNGASWTLSFHSTSPPVNSVQFLTEVAIVDSIFILFSPRDLSFSSDHPPVWTVVNALSKVENVFTTENEYKTYLKKMNLKNLHFYPIHSVFEKFAKSKKLPSEWPEKH